MQMRGSMSQRSFESDKMSQALTLSDESVGPGNGKKTSGSLGKLCLAESIRDLGRKIIRHEQARSTVYGAWNNLDKNGLGNGGQGERRLSMEQKACINLLAGLRGSGKTTLGKFLNNYKLYYCH